jgi:hypothetical protein
MAFMLEQDQMGILLQLFVLSSFFSDLLRREYRLQDVSRPDKSSAKGLSTSFPNGSVQVLFFMQTVAADDWMSECDSLASQLQLYIVTKESAHNLSHGFQKQGGCYIAT